jgi:16S rRNA G966 N2-methylase RsmD
VTDLAIRQPDEEANALGQLSAARRELAAATTLPEIAGIVERATAVTAAARLAKMGIEKVNEWADLTLDAKRKGGQTIATMQDRGELARPQDGRPSKVSQALTLSELELNRQAASHWQLIGWLPEVDYEEYKAKREAAEKEITAAGAVALAKRLQRQQDNLASTQPTATIPTIAEASWHEWLPEQPACDLLITDPPYSTDIDDVEAFATTWLPVALDKVKPTGRAYVCIGAYPDELRAYLNVPPPNGLVLANVLVWTYRNTLGPSPTHDYKQNWQAILYYRGQDAPPLDCPKMIEQFTVQDLNAPDGRLGDRYHAWQKPIELADRLIRHATQPDQRVLDPFAGTGTFLLAAAALGRQAAGCDLDPDMLAIAQERGCQLAG